MKAIGITISDKWYESPKPKDQKGNIIGEYPAYTGLVKYKITAFDFERENYIHFEKIEIQSQDIFRRFLRITQELWDKVDFDFINKRYQDTEIVFDNISDESLTLDEEDELEKAQGIFADKVSSALDSIRDTYECLTSDESIKESFIANEYLFTLDGRID